jgi:hypothetical protein
VPLLDSRGSEGANLSRLAGPNPHPNGWGWKNVGAGTFRPLPWCKRSVGRGSETRTPLRSRLRGTDPHPSRAGLEGRTRARATVGLLPAPENRGDDAGAAAAMQHGDHQQRAFLRSVGEQVVAHGYEPQRP